MSIATLFSVVVLLIFAGFLAASESALTSLSRLLIEQIVDAKPNYAKRFSRFTENPARYLNVLLLVRKSCELTATVLVAAAFIEITDNKALALTQTIVLMVAISYVIVGVGPRTLGKQNALSWSKSAIITADVLSKLLGPLTNLLIAVGNAITPGKGFKTGPFSTEAEFRDLVDQASESGFVEESEREMIHSVFDLGETMVRELMVPRTEMVWIEKGKTLRQAISLSLRSGYSRIPVIGEDSDDIVGVVYLKDISRRIFENAEAERTELVDNLMRAAYFVPDSKPADELLRDMQSARVHLAVVIDEYGGTAGLVTIEDILEEIVGEITDEYDTHAPEVNELGPNVYRVSSRIHLDDLAELINLNLSSDDEGVDTLSGYLAKQLERIPIPGTSIVIEGWEFVAERAAGRRNKIGTILIRKSESPDSE